MNKNITQKKLDDVCRLVIPSDLRKKLNLSKHDYVDLQLIDNHALLIRKHDFSTDYEMLLRNILIDMKGTNFRNIFISNEILNDFEITIKSFVKKYYNQKRR